jgi:hypothetical protein
VADPERFGIRERYTGDDPADRDEVHDLLAREGVSGDGG